MTTEIPGFSTPAVMHVDQFLALAEPGFHFLLNHSWTDVHSEKDFAASLTVGKMILQAISREPGILARAVEEVCHASEAAFGVLFVYILDCRKQGGKA